MRKRQGNANISYHILSYPIISYHISYQIRSDHATRVPAVELPVPERDPDVIVVRLHLGEDLHVGVPQALVVTHGVVVEAAVVRPETYFTVRVVLVHVCAVLLPGELGRI